MLGIGGDKPKNSKNGNHSVETLIGPQVIIRGDIHFSGGIYLEGQVHGKIISQDAENGVLTIAEKGRIEGEVRAPIVVINGELVGDVHAFERVELAANARVHGNIFYKVLEMAAGATVSGRLVHSDAPQQALPAPQKDEHPSHNVMPTKSAA